MVEWRHCNHCGKAYSIVPIALGFDPEGTKLGGVFYCQNCNFYYTSHFLTPQEIKDLKEKNVEKISQQKISKEGLSNE